ncbi:MAG: hypothetical protein ABEJ61_06660 [Haloferacaceae archaeon]
MLRGRRALGRACPGTRTLRSALGALLALALFATPAAAHSGSLRGTTRDPVTVPTWLFLLTGGAVVGVSFLLASFVTDRDLVAAGHDWGRPLPSPGRAAVAAGRLLAVAGLAAVLVAGWVGPSTAERNLAVLVVWAGWWGGYVAATYLVGDAWPALNPFRTVAERLPSLDRPYPDRLGAWPSVAGLLALVWVEVTMPLADDPRLLATAVAGYALVTVAGAVVVGPDRWFGSVDPVARLLAYYGRVAPLGRTDDGWRLRLPGGALAAPRPADCADGGDASDESPVRSAGDVAFVVAILFVTTYDGLVATGPWATAVEALVGVGAPPMAVYLGAYLGGYALFLGAYRLAVRAARRYGETYRTRAALARRFAPPLLAIAAGYHLAHNFGTVLTLAPALATVAANPLAPPVAPPLLVTPDWLSGVSLAAVLVGHLLAVWVAHAAAYDLFPDRLQAVRSQYGVTVVMVLFTMLSLWIVAEPYVPPPYIVTP